MTLEQYFGESYRYIWSDNWCLDDDRVWFIAGAMNILFCLDLNKKETIVVDKIPSDGFRQHPKCMKKGNYVICIPDNGMDIWCYHIPDGSWLRIPVETPLAFFKQIIYCIKRTKKDFRSGYRSC